MHSPVRLVVDSVASFNVLLLDALSGTARERPLAFPLDATLREHFCRLDTADGPGPFAFGICLADAHFSDDTLWTRTGADLPEDCFGRNARMWISDVDRVVLAQSLFLIAWQSVRSLPSLSSVLFGMTPQVHDQFRTRTLADVMGFARSRSQWLYPRWHNRPEVWTHLLGAQPGRKRRPAPQLRLLQACASESERLLSSGLRVSAPASTPPRKSLR